MVSSPRQKRRLIGWAERQAGSGFFRWLSPQQREMMPYNWRVHAHEGQVPPDGEWGVWLLMGGRGYGKTRAGSEWVRAIANSDPQARIALVSSSLAEARSVMVEGDSGILAVSRGAGRPIFEPSRRLLRWRNGAQAQLYSASEPEALRGPQHSLAWCDELAKWDRSGGRAQACWDNLQLGLRLGSDPRILVTTTPRNVPLLSQIVEDPHTAMTRGRTSDNAANLSASFLGAVERQFGGTALGRQELDGALLKDVEGALWSRSLLERCRRAPVEAAYARVVVAVDPPAGAEGDACGIVVAALLEDGNALVLADCSVEKPSPERWASAVAEAFRNWNADRVVAEANQGGAMVESVLRAADRALPIRLVHASRGKVARAEPVAALYEAGRVFHAGQFAALEDELCALIPGSPPALAHSPDRADALVWALTELMLGHQANPRVSAF